MLNVEKVVDIPVIQVDVQTFVSYNTCFESNCKESKDKTSDLREVGDWKPLKAKDLLKAECIWINALQLQKRQQNTIIREGWTIRQ